MKNYTAILIAAIVVIGVVRVGLAAASASTTNATSTEAASTSTVSVDVDPSSIASTTIPSSTSTTTPSGTTSQPVITPGTFHLAHVVGIKYIDYFTDGTTTYSFPGDPNIDANLNKPDAPTPTHGNLTWVSSSGVEAYDTPSGNLEPGTYAQESNGSYIVNNGSKTSFSSIDPTVAAIASIPAPSPSVSPIPFNISVSTSTLDTGSSTPSAATSTADTSTSATQ